MRRTSGPAMIHWLMQRLAETGERLTMAEFAWLLGQNKNTARVHYYSLKRQGRVPEGLEFVVEPSVAYKNTLTMGGLRKLVWAARKEWEPGDDKLDGEVVGRALASMEGIEKEVLRRRFGFAGKEETLDEIGKSWGTSRQWVEQVEKKALARIRKRVTRGRL